MSLADSDKKMALLWLKIAVIYLVIGVAYGIVLSASHQYQFRGIHAHINLLGWATLALAGMMYHLYPSAARSRLGYIHFWLHNAPLPVLLVSLHFYVAGTAALEPVLALASVIIGLGILAFSANVLLNMRADQPAALPKAQEWPGTGRIAD